MRQRRESKSSLYDDPEVLRRLCDGDASVQELVYRAEFPRLVKQAEAILGRGEAAENLVTDVLTDFFYQYVKQLREPRSIGAYLRIMTIRRSRRAMTRLRRQVELQPEAAGCDPRPSADWDVDREIFLAWLEQCLAQLGNRTRKILKMHYGHEMSCAEIGLRLEISKQAVSKRNGKSLVALKRCLERRRLAWVRKGRADD